MASHSQRPQAERLVIGITGHIGSGKTTIGQYLESRKGFQYVRYSAVLADWRIHDSESKDQLQKVGWEVMAGGLQAELNRRLIAQMLPDRNVAVDGLRHPLDYDALHNSFFPSFHLLFMDTPRDLRFDRLSRKGKYVGFASFQAADSHPVEQQIDSLRTNSSNVIHNEGSLLELYAAVDEAVSSFWKEGQS
jgi:dephospho-CoA kinase